MRIRKIYFFIFFMMMLILAWVVLLSYIPNKSISHEVALDTRNDSLVKVLVTGDTGFGDDNQRRVAALMETMCVAENPHAVILLGDNFYYTGVSSVDDPQWDSKFNHIYNSPCLSQKKFYTVFGNHDYRNNPQAQIDYTNKSPQWNLPARFYKLSAGEIVDFFAIDTNFPDKCGSKSLCSLDWIEDKISSSGASWKIVFGHHPALSGGKYKKLAFIPSYILPSFLCNAKPHLYISGHDHNMQHLKGKYVNKGCDIHQLIVGGGGAPIYIPSEVPGKTIFAKGVHGAALLSLSSTELKGKIFDANSSDVIYEFSEKKEF